MRINVKLFATLRNNRQKELKMDLTHGATPKDIIDSLNISKDEASIIIINGIITKLDRVLEDNDTVSIFPAVGGG